MATLALFLFVGRVAAAPNIGGGPNSLLTGAINSLGGVQSVGSITVAAIGTPSAGSVVNIGTAGSTTYTYACVAQDINANETIPSATFTTTTGNATLSATNFNRVFCGGQTGAVAYRILKTDTAHKIGVCLTQSGQSCSFDDLGVASTSYTALTVDGTGAVTGASGSVVNGGTITLNGSVSGVLTLIPAATTTSYTLTFPATVPAQGDILDFSNGTGQISSLVDVAVGRVLTSGGVGAVPTYSATPALGVGGTTSGTLTLANATGTGLYTLAQAASTTTYTETTKAVAPAQGDILDYSNATGQRSSLVDVAVNQVLTSGGVGAVPVYSGTPTIASLTANGTGDLIVLASNGGHISSQKGSASLASPGTGTVTAGGTDNAMIVTGATSPVTITFATAFSAVPICVCSDITSALGACKAVGGGGGASVVVTTTGTDSFNLVCIGK